MAGKEKTMGSLKKIYILHGWTYSLEKWQDFLDLLSKNGLEPILLKVPGLTEVSDRVWNLDDYVEWLKKETENDDSFVLIGHSNGGRIALAFTVRHPQRVKHLVLIDSAGIYHNEFAIRTKRLFFASLAKIGKKLTNSEALRSILYKLTRESDYKNANPQMRQTLVNLIQSDKDLDIGIINVPTTIIWGQNDKITPFSDGRVMAQKIKSAKLYIVKSAGHSPQYSHPKEVSQKIIEELK